MCMVLGGQKSDWLFVTPGVPQGSILEPFVFTIFINDIPNQITNPSQIALYADDSKISRVITNMKNNYRAIYMKCS